MLPWLSLVLVLLVTGVALCTVTVFLMAQMLLTPPRMTDAKALVVLRRLSPTDVGLDFQELTFDIHNEATGQPLRIAAWWIPMKRPTDRTVIIIHGYGDAKVGGIAWAPMFHEMGWNILAIDLRAHGESGGTQTTAGYWERHDLNQILNRLRTDRPKETQTLILFGVSLGAAVALAAAVTRDDLAAVVLEGPFADYGDAVAAHGRLFGAPGGILQDLALRLAQNFSRADFGAVRPVDLIPQSPCPVMVIHGAEDAFMIKDEARRLSAALAKHAGPRDVFWEVPAAGHVLCLSCDPISYRTRVEAFLNSVTRSPQGPL
ncbi:MAG TPA: alpha/beta hydrolase [Tepidisphaeraceae bacterium]